MHKSLKSKDKKAGQPAFFMPSANSKHRRNGGYSLIKAEKENKVTGNGINA